MGLFSELKRRNVVRVGIAYLLVAWIVLQATDFALQVLGAPDWVLRVFVLAAAIGLPVALVFSWVFELTPDGLKRDADCPPDTQPSNRRKLDYLIMGSLLVAVVYLGWDKFAREQVPAPAKPGEPAFASGPPASSTESSFEKSIVVLPFVNMSADQDNEFFSDGVSEEILNVLARVPELKVAARTSAFAFKGSDAKVADIARELGVNHVLEGSVRKSGNQVRVTAQLIKADDGFNLWSDSYDRELVNIFAIQDEIAGHIAEALKVSLMLAQPGEDNLTGTNSLQAYEFYLKGMSLWHKRGADNLYAAIEAFESAISLDPEFARGWSGLALTWAVLDGYTTVDATVSMLKARQTAQKSLELDPDNSQALVALAQSMRKYEERAESRALFDRAIDMAPSFATAYQWRGRANAVSGRLDMSIADYKKAAELDPRSPVIATNTGWWLATDNQMEVAITATEAVLEWAPDFANAIGQSLMFSLMTRDCELARTHASTLTERYQKPADSVQLYLDYCQREDLLKHQAAVDTFASWGGNIYIYEPSHPALIAPAETHNMLIETGDHEAAFTLMKQLPVESSYGDLWLSGRNTEQGRIYACRPDVQQWMAEQKLQFGVTSNCP